MILCIPAGRDGTRITGHIIPLAGLAPRFVQFTIRCFKSLCTSRISHLHMPGLDHSFKALFQPYEFVFTFPSEAIAPEFAECRTRVSFV